MASKLFYDCGCMEQGDQFFHCEEHMLKRTNDFNFQIKDSGERKEFSSGMVRDVTEGKIDYTLITDGPMFKRWATHLTKGAAKYGKRNWLNAEGEEEYLRFRESAFRHFMQWYFGEVDEDHASAVYFNIDGAELVRAKKEKG